MIVTVPDIFKGFQDQEVMKSDTLMLGKQCADFLGFRPFGFSAVSNPAFVSNSPIRLRPKEFDLLSFCHLYPIFSPINGSFERSDQNFSEIEEDLVVMSISRLWPKRHEDTD